MTFGACVEGAFCVEGAADDEAAAGSMAGRADEAGAGLGGREERGEDVWEGVHERVEGAMVLR